MTQILLRISEEKIGGWGLWDKHFYFAAFCLRCHVMERESFESEEVAKIMNDNFVNIKVDREERPDIDKVYMTFVQVSSSAILY